MNKTAFGVFCIALSALLLELNLIRVFDVLWYPNMAYMVITLAVFSFGLAGVFLCIKRIEFSKKTWQHLSFLTTFTAIWALSMQTFIDRLPFDYNQLNSEQALSTGINFLLIYVVICVPFFLSGLVLSLVFTYYTKHIRTLYFWDLVGAAIGCLLLIPLLPQIGTAGVMYVVAGLALISTLCFSWGQSKHLSFLLVIIIAVIIISPFTKEQIDSFKPHMHKRAYRDLVQNINDGTWWDPISKINVLDTEKLHIKRKWIAYDGGTQTSYFYPFDGDFDKLRSTLPQNAVNHFWNAYVAVSHYIKADTNANVLIIGSAGGQELKAALTYNAKHVDGVELVGTVVALGKSRYADYIGNIMNEPRANIQRGEGRSFLRQSGKIYDIIQIFSNHTSSSIAAGSGAMQANYLQTTDAYKEYFQHLSKDGILHINHHIYPRMVATASKAWKELGRDNFRAHVFVSDVANVRDDLPTLLIKMSPWTKKEIADIKQYLSGLRFPVDPFDAKASFLTDDFFTGALPQSIIDAAPYRIEEPTDNQPFFNSLRKNLNTLPEYDQTKFVNHGISALLNSQKKSGYPIDVMHLFITAGAAIIFAIIFTLGPLFFAKTGREKWTNKGSFMLYFCCLGLGFIIFELVFIQIFMKLIGYPLYTYTSVLFTFLFGAALGSLASEKWKLLEEKKIWLPFIGIILSTLFIIICKTFLFDTLLELRTILRIITTVILIFPLAFFLGMPFPMGILTIANKPQGTVAWAWALNGLCTVAGGVFCAIFSVYFGFIYTLIVAMCAYIVAYIAFKKLHSGISI